MNEYHKINSVFKRDERGNFLIGEWSEPEFEYLADNPWLWTEKIDGTNIRIMWKPDEDSSLAITQAFGGKTDNAQIPNKLVNWLNDHFHFTQGELRQVFNVLEMETFPQVCLYGEGYGAGIQKSGGLYSAEQKFILFDVKIGHWWLKRDAVEDIAQKLGLDVVRQYSPTSLNNMIDFVSQGLVVESAFPNIEKPEGYVGTPLVPLFNRKGERIITKVKYKDFK